MSSKSSIVLIALLLARIAAAEPIAEDASRPWHLRSMTIGNLVQADSTAAAFRDPQGNIDLAVTTALAATTQLTDRWAPVIRVAAAGNNAPGAALDGTSFGNPLVGATYGRSMTSRRLALFGGVTIPIGSGGGNAPDPRAARTNAASITARPADEAMFDVNYVTAIVGADVAYVKHGFTMQGEVSLLQSVRVRGDETIAGTDAFRTRATLGAHVGVSLGNHISLGADLEYRRWLSHPTMLDAMTDPRVPSAHEEPATLTAAIGLRMHVRLGTTSIHPGLSYTRGFDGLAPHGPLSITKQTNAVGITLPVQF